MLRKKTADLPKHASAGTVLAKGITIQNGNMSGSGDVRIGGMFFGDINIDGLLIIEDGGNIKGVIKSKDVIVEGTLEGNIIAENLVYICSTGKIYGDIKCLSLVVDAGAAFAGLCKTISEEESNNKPTAETLKNNTDMFSLE